MQDGFYRVDFAGASDSGIGAFAVVRGTVAGLDAAGVTYKGTYQAEGADLVGTMSVSAAPGTLLINGTTAGPMGAQFEVTLRARSNGLVEVQSPLGAIRGRMSLISPL